MALNEKVMSTDPILHPKPSSKWIPFVAGIVAKLLNRPYLNKRLPACYRSFGAVWTEGINLSCYAIGMVRSYKLNSLTIETNNTCNLSCIMCPVNHQMERKKEYMDFDLYKKIIDMAVPLGTLQLTGLGEPTLHPNICDMIAYAKMKRVEVVNIITNGTLIDEQKCIELLESGLDFITFSLDGLGEVHEEIRGKGSNYERIRNTIFNFVRLREKINPSCMVSINYTAGATNTNNDSKSIKEFENYWRGKVDFTYISSSIDIKSKLRTKACIFPWRLLVVQSNGNVVPCCIDFEGQLNIGNAKEQSVKKIFNSDKMVELRRKHIRKDFPAPCIKCGEYTNYS